VTSVMVPTDPRILIADDDDDLRQAVRDLLEDQQFIVVGEAVDGADAVTKAIALDPDVILIDLRMPDVDGIEATRRIKARLPMVQIVMLSAYGDPGLISAAENAGVYAYLVKGCPAELIRHVLTSAFSFKVGLLQRQTEGRSAEPTDLG
jgi:DNA-binding NarL/FixJ family response regulator